MSSKLNSPEQLFVNKVGTIAIGYRSIIEGDWLWIIETDLGAYLTKAKPEFWGWESLGYLK